MRRDAVFKIFAALVCLASALVVYIVMAGPLGADRPIAHGMIGVVVATLASGCAAKLIVPISVFGQQWRLSAPLILIAAASYVLRFLLVDPDGRALAHRLWRRSPEPPRAPAAPYALPARVAVALAAAARARK